MTTIFMAILKTLLTKLVTEKVLIAVFLHVAESLAKKSTNTLDDKLVEEVKKALNESYISPQFGSFLFAVDRAIFRDKNSQCVF